MDTIVIPKGDYGFNLSFAITDANGDAFDLTGYTVALQLWRPATPGTLALDEDCTIDVAADGTCHYTVQVEDFDTAETYAGRLLCTASGKEERVKPLRVVITESG